MKNKRDRLFFTQLFVPQASQSSYDRRAELDVRLAIPSAQSACGMEIFMEEKQIIAMLWKRDEYGLKLLQEQYSAKLMTLACNFVSVEDAEECVNDVLLAVWHSIPPKKPDNLFAYTARICRNKALNKIRSKERQKRKAEVIELSNELQNIIPNKVDEESLLTELINDFLAVEQAQDRYLFVHRYWFGESIAELSERTGYGASKVKSKLFRTRKRLKHYLEGRYRL